MDKQGAGGTFNIW